MVMIDGSFRERYHAVDSFCRQDMSPSEYEVIWVESYNAVSPLLREKEQQYGNFRVVTLNRTGEYHSSYCFNRGIVESRGELLVIPDADVLVERNFLRDVAEEHRQCEDLAMYIYRYNEMKEDHREDIDMNRLRAVCRLTGPTNFGGCLTVRKRWLLQINGYEQHPVFGSGFHANGADVAGRFRVLGLKIKWHPQLKLYHPYHDLTLTHMETSYNKQLRFIEWRRRKLQWLAYQGIDQARDRVLEQELVAFLEEGPELTFAGRLKKLVFGKKGN